MFKKLKSLGKKLIDGVLTHEKKDKGDRHYGRVNTYDRPVWMPGKKKVSYKERTLQDQSTEEVFLTAPGSNRIAKRVEHFDHGGVLITHMIRENEEGAVDHDERLWIGADGTMSLSKSEGGNSHAKHLTMHADGTVHDEQYIEDKSAPHWEENWSFPANKSGARRIKETMHGESRKFSFNTDTHTGIGRKRSTVKTSTITNYLHHQRKNDQHHYEPREIYERITHVDGKARGLYAKYDQHTGKPVLKGMIDKNAQPSGVWMVRKDEDMTDVGHQKDGEAVGLHAGLSDDGTVKTVTLYGDNGESITLKQPKHVAKFAPLFEIADKDKGQEWRLNSFENLPQPEKISKELVEQFADCYRIEQRDAFAEQVKLLQEYTDTLKSGIVNADGSNLEKTNKIVDHYSA